MNKLKKKLKESKIDMKIVIKIPLIKRHAKMHELKTKIGSTIKDRQSILYIIII